MWDKPLVGNRYQLIEPLGEGGIAETYKAKDTHLPRHPLCVIKKLKYVTDLNSQKTIDRLFRREAETLETLGHYDSIPKLLAFFKQDDQFYLVQDFIAGHDLKSKEITGRHRKWSEAQATQFLLEMLHILKMVHAHKVIHRDIKPSNIMRRQSDAKLMLIDFGSTRYLQEQGWGSTPKFVRLLHSRGSEHLTIVGTPIYMPEEQRDGRVFYASDIFALGMTAIEALTGRDFSQVHTDPTGEVVWQPYMRVSDGFAAILGKMVRRYHHQRYQSVDEVIQALSMHDVASPASDDAEPQSPSLPLLSDVFNTQIPTRVASKRFSIKWPKLPALPIELSLNRWAIFLLVVVGGIGVTTLAVWGARTYELARRQTLVERLTQAKTDGNFDQCINLAADELQDRSSEDREQQFFNDIQMVKGECHLEQSESLKQENRLNAAITVLVDIDKSYGDQLYETARYKIKMLGTDICQRAEKGADNASNQQQFNDFIQNGKTIHEQAPNHQACINRMSYLYRLWNENQAPQTQANTALTTGKCRAARSAVNRLRGTRYRYWKGVIADLDQKIGRCLTPLNTEKWISTQSPKRQAKNPRLERPYEAHTFYGYQGQTIAVETQALQPEFDPIIYLLEPNGNVLFRNDDAQVGDPNAGLRCPLSQTGTYKVVVTTYRAREKYGPYRLTVKARPQSIQKCLPGIG